jgi:Uma2 family endonuclease
MEATVAKKRGAKTKKIPEYLIYEMDDGKPIYYRGYREHLQGQRELEEIMSSSYLQSFLVSELIQLLGKKLSGDYRILTNELGLQFKKKSWRAADIAIYKKADLKNHPLDNKYLPIPPKIVIEVDTKASFENFNTPMDYYTKKTDALLNFGVEKVIWIFTDAKKVMTATKNTQWVIDDWKVDVAVMENLNVNIEKLMEEE